MWAVLKKTNLIKEIHEHLIVLTTCDTNLDVNLLTEVTGRKSGPNELCMKVVFFQHLLPDFQHKAQEAKQAKKQTERMTHKLTNSSIFIDL